MRPGQGRIGGRRAVVQELLHAAVTDLVAGRGDEREIGPGPARRGEARHAPRTATETGRPSRRAASSQGRSLGATRITGTGQGCSFWSTL